MTTYGKYVHTDTITVMASSPLSSILADRARLEANIQALTEKINGVESIELPSPFQEANLVEWRKERAEDKTNLKETRDKEQQELLRIGGGTYVFCFVFHAMEVANVFSEQSYRRDIRSRAHRERAFQNPPRYQSPLYLC